ncbi:methylosome subunit pICln [Episyrphus balteatus]|uniref:methylosome subunit pICln n=1 Tax=Episyrphus balteatus TaxID=286459 RepID=UPI002484FA9D|nr:methylosome subunit pICln [Episyrphus balteatus]XP_055849602.1 methylosome subunit pICln [Episyrphus balteatus]
MVIIRPINLPDAGLVYSSPNTQLKIADRIIGTGTLYVNQDSLEWMPADRPEGLSILWKQISVHGVAPNPVKCIYFMLDHKLVWDGVYGDIVIPNGNGVNDDESEDDEESNSDQMTEMWLIPNDPNTVDSIYQAMTDCQALHPDSAESISGSESDYMDFESVGQDRGDDDDENDDNVGGNMQDLNINDERFADAEE